MSQKRKAPNGTAKSTLQRIAFTIDESTLEQLDELAAMVRKQAADAGVIPHGVDQGRSSAIRQAIQYMHLHRKVV